MQVWPKITQAILIDFKPWITGIVSLPTVLSQIVFMFALSENDRRVSLKISPET